MTSRYLYKPSFVFLDTQAVCIPIIVRHSVDTCCPRNVSYWSERLSRPFFSTVHVPKSFLAMMFLAQRTSIVFTSFSITAPTTNQSPPISFRLSHTSCVLCPPHVSLFALLAPVLHYARTSLIRPVIPLTSSVLRPSLCSPNSAALAPVLHYARTSLIRPAYKAALSHMDLHFACPIIPILPLLVSSQA